MTLPAPLDDSVRVAAPAAEPTPLERLWVGHSGRPPRSLVARILGASPVAAADRPAFAEAVVEAQVTQRLRTLAVSGESWRVLHVVPVGRTELDHVVIGPAGVFAVTVGEPGDVAAAADLLSEALGRRIEVGSVVVPVPPRRSGAQELAAASVVSATRLVGHLQGLRPVLSVDEVREVNRAALGARTWAARVPRVVEAPAAGEPSADARRADARPLPRRDELAAWFGRVRAEVDRARRVQLTWAAAGTGVLLALALSGPGIAGAFVG